MILTVSHIVDAIDVFRPLFIIHVLPLAPDNLNRILRKKESAGIAVGTDSEWTAMSEDRKGEIHPSQASPYPFPVSGKDKSLKGKLLRPCLHSLPHSTGGWKGEKDGVRSC